jgi:hypothetical protein
MARMSFGLLLLATLALILGFAVDHSFAVASLVFSAVAFVAILAAHNQLRRRQRAEAPAEGQEAAEPADDDAQDEPGVPAEAFAPGSLTNDHQPRAGRVARGARPLQHANHVKREKPVEPAKLVTPKPAKPAKPAKEVTPKPAPPPVLPPPEPVAKKKPPPPPLPPPKPPEPEPWFVIENYGRLTVAQIVAVLDLLDADELAEVREREKKGAGRATVLKPIEHLLAAESRRTRR